VTNEPTGCGDDFLDLRIERRSTTVSIQCAPGSLYYKVGMHLAILKDADAVLFLVSGDPRDAELGSEHFGLTFDLSIYASKLWGRCPWIFAVNKIDLGRVNPLASRLPEEFLNSTHEIQATTGQGTDLLYQHVLQVLGVE